MLFGDALPNRPPTWHPPPDYRGSFTILSTCIITLTLCIWTAVHLNIPEHQKGSKRSKWDPRGWITKQLWRKMGWLILGLLAPEMIAFTAWVQRRDAQRFNEEIQGILAITPASNQGIELNTVEHCEQPSLERLARNDTRPLRTLERDVEPGIREIRDDSFPKQPRQDENIPIATEPVVTVDAAKPATKTVPRKHQWTQTHSFLVVSGGFAFDTSDLPENQKFLPGSRDRVTLSQTAVLELARYEPSLVPDISEAAIKDKSKANALAKTIVCLQATWFIINCIVRLAQDLSISLLELNTFAHSICALLIYSLWWNKPLDIEEPAIINKESMHGICALLCFYSEFDGIRDSSRLNFINKELGVFEGPVLSSGYSQTSPSQPPDGPTCLTPGQILPGGAVRVIHFLPKSVSRNYQPRDLRRWNLAHSVWIPYYHSPRGSVRDRVRNWPTDFGFGETFGLLIDDDIDSFLLSTNWEGVVVLFAFTLAGLAYGALHLVAWKSPFTSYAQKMLWRISALAIAASGPALIVLAAMFRPLVRLRRYLGKHIRRPSSRLLIYSIYGLGLLLILSYALFYLFARVFLVVECFISLAYLPDIVFQQSRWTFYFPHIT